MFGNKLSNIFLFDSFMFKIFGVLVVMYEYKVFV